jgi:HEAT repeat protein
MPRRVAGVPPEQGDDHDARALLDANGLESGPAGLVELLDSGVGVVQAAAARVLGADGVRQAVPQLERLARDPAAEETVRVQAAYALARLGVDEGHDLLRQLVSLDPETGPAAVQAAAALAALGDPAGFDVERRALESPNQLTAMVAAKQLHAFADLDVDLDEAWARALGRPERPVVGEALAQLAALPPERAAAIEARARG